MKKFCPKCGKEIKTGVFCDNCKPRIIDYKPAKIKLCVDCNKVFINGAWKKTDLKKAIKTELSNKIKQKNIAINLPDTSKLMIKPGLKTELIAEIVQDEAIHEIPITIETTYCNICSKKGTQYFEGVLQLRNINKKNQKIINKEIEFEKKHNNFINKVVEYKNGLDLYFTNKKFLPKLAQRLISKAGGLTTSSSKLFSYNSQKGKNIYRLNVLVEFPEFNKNEIIQFDKKILKIKKLGKTNTAINLLTQKKFMFDYKTYKKLKQENKIKRLKEYETRIIKTHPEITALDPRTYQEIKVINAKNEEIDTNIRIVIVKNQAIITGKSQENK